MQRGKWKQRTISSNSSSSSKSKSNRSRSSNNNMKKNSNNNNNSSSNCNTNPKNSSSNNKNNNSNSNNNNNSSSSFSRIRFNSHKTAVDKVDVVSNFHNQITPILKKSPPPSAKEFTRYTGMLSEVVGILAKRNSILRYAAAYSPNLERDKQYSLHTTGPQKQNHESNRLPRGLTNSRFRSPS